MHVAVDESGEEGKAGCVNNLRIAGNLDARALARVRHMPVLDHDDRFARGVACGRVQERVGVEDPNHRPMLMRP
jgi:hypothetical protein